MGITAYLLQSQSSGGTTLFDVCYDIKNETWIKWSTMNLEDHGGVISGDFTRDNLDLREIIRLNYDSIEYISGKIHQEKNVIFIPESGMFVETAATKLIKYFMQFAIAYSKPTLLISESQNGATSCVLNKMKALIEHHSYSTAFIALNKTTSLKQVSLLFSF